MSRIERASHISIVVVSIAAFVCLIPTLRSSLFPSQHSVAASRMVGKKFELPGAHWARGSTTVVAALSSRCPFCIASLPFYRELSSIAAASRGRVSLLVASTTPDVDGVRTLLQDYDVVPAKIVQASLRNLHASGTPTIYVVDASGTIKWAHVGQLDDSLQKELLRLLNGLGAHE